MNTRELNKLSVVHFKGSAQLTQFSLAEHKLYQAVSWSVIYKLYHGSKIKCKIPERVLLNGAICKRFSKVSRR